LAASELALQTGLNGEQRELVETVKTSAESLLTIINDILDVSKIEAGKLTFDPIPFSLRKMMHGAVNAHQVAARKKGLLLSCHIRVAALLDRSLRDLSLHVGVEMYFHALSMRQPSSPFFASQS
jgi:signal transduction histidine kinase